jgi:hypothetical protein
MRALCVAALAAASAGSSACYRTAVHSGLPPGDVAPGTQDAWHSGFLFGLVETSGPHQLAELCERGWSEIKTQVDPLAAATTIVTLGLYTPQRVTVVCALEGAPAVAPERLATPAPELEPDYPPAQNAYPPPPPPPEAPRDHAP